MASSLDPYKVLPGRVTNDEIREALDNVSLEFGRHARRNRVLLFGDSISAGGWYLSGGNPTYGYHAFVWANMLLDWPFDIVPVLDYSFSGYTTTQLLAEVDAAAAEEVDLVILMAGTNDSPSGDPAVIAANLLSMWRTFVRSGKTVVACTITPRDYGDASSDVVRATNDLIRANAAAEPGVLLCDWHSSIIDTANGDAHSDFLTDQVHPNYTGHSRMGTILASVLAPYAPGNYSFLPQGPGNDNGMLPNPFMVGDTSGGATSTNFYDLGSGTHVKTKVARVDGIPGEWQQLVVTAPTPNADGAQIQQQNTNVGVDWNVGDTVYGIAEFETDAAGWDIYAFTLGMFFFTANQSTNALTIGSSDLAQLTAPIVRPARGVIRTPEMVVPATTTRLQLNFYIRGAGTVRVGRFDIIRTATA